MRKICRSYIAVFLAAVLLLAGCGSGAGETTDEREITGSMELSYATQFHVDYYSDGTALLHIEDGLDYLIVPEGCTPEGEIPENVTVINTPVTDMYLAASSAMDLISAIDGLDQVSMTATAASDWALPEIRELVESDTIHYAGKYRAPDFEALVEGEIDLAVESTMIYHNPQVKEAIEELGIPVLVERSSYETDPLGRLEWIKVYGLLLGREEEAEAYFNSAVDKIKSVDTENIGDAPETAFFSVNSAGAVIARKPGDYVTKMIETAGGRYALDGIVVEDENAISTMNMQMEAFYEAAVDSDILIYNSTIESDLTYISDLTAKSELFKDFKAVKEGNVWCTNKNVFQKSTGAADMIIELNRIFAGEQDDSGFEYFHKLK